MGNQNFLLPAALMDSEKLAFILKSLPQEDHLKAVTFANIDEKIPEEKLLEQVESFKIIFRTLSPEDQWTLIKQDNKPARFILSHLKTNLQFRSQVLDSPVRGNIIAMLRRDWDEL